VFIGTVSAGGTAPALSLLNRLRDGARDDAGDATRTDIAMKTNWLVVANAARARVLEETERAGAYAHVADLVHPESRMKGEELGGDRPGQVHAEGHGSPGTSYTPRTSPREREHERFAREVASTVNGGVAQDRCAGITLVASDPFLGHLKSHLSPQARKLLLRTVAADYTTLRDDELAERIAAAR